MSFLDISAFGEGGGKGEEETNQKKKTEFTKELPSHSKTFSLNGNLPPPHCDHIVLASLHCTFPLTMPPALVWFLTIVIHTTHAGNEFDGFDWKLSWYQTRLGSVAVRRADYFWHFPTIFRWESEVGFHALCEYMHWSVIPKNEFDPDGVEYRETFHAWIQSGTLSRNMLHLMTLRHRYVIAMGSQRFFTQSVFSVKRDLYPADRVWLKELILHSEWMGWMNRMGARRWDCVPRLMYFLGMNALDLAEWLLLSPEDVTLSHILFEFVHLGPTLVKDQIVLWNQLHAYTLWSPHTICELVQCCWSLYKQLGSAIRTEHVETFATIREASDNDVQYAVFTYSIIVIRLKEYDDEGFGNSTPSLQEEEHIWVKSKGERFGPADHPFPQWEAMRLDDDYQFSPPPTLAERRIEVVWVSPSRLVLPRVRLGPPRLRDDFIEHMDGIDYKVNRWSGDTVRL